ncbi:putative peroxin 11C [Rosellinia necatrix]|uniref:Putative peroxin 11C n=1 Tax=Rosellinia necatrix TaxID=77044 RepID=A0A1S8A8T8_ROSNE|nr:putative peroxin 11C [Rosellinia necatrix]
MSSTEPIATTDLPSGDPVPSSPPPLPAPKPKPLPLRELLAAAPSNADAFLAHLQRCFATPSGTDTVLLFVCYSSRLASAVLTTLVQPALHRSAERLVALASALPPSATLLFDAKTLPSAGVALVLALARRLKALSGLASEARTITRLWGLLGMYFWARRLVLKRRQQKEQGGSSGSSSGSSSGGGGDGLETAVAWSQLASCVVFQALENGAYLASRGVLGWSPAAQGRAARWSARFWGAFVGLELVRLGLESGRRGRRTRAEKFAGGKTVADVEREEREWSAAWRRALVRNLAWAPLTVHWSLEQGLVSEMTIGALASIPSVLQIRDLWRNTAE